MKKGGLRNGQEFMKRGSYGQQISVLHFQESTPPPDYAIYVMKFDAQFESLV